jgi:hypothetical protein
MLKLKTFENFSNDRLWREVSKDEWLKFIDSRKKDSFTNYEVDQIKSLPNYSAFYDWNFFEVSGKVVQIYFWRNSDRVFTIVKFEDEWFGLNISSEEPGAYDSIWFVCDSFDGLLQLIKKIKTN